MATPSSGFVGETPYQRFGPLDDPIMQALYDRILSSIPQVTQPKRGAQEFINQGISSPLLSAILEPVPPTQCNSSGGGGKAMKASYLFSSS